MKIGPADDGTYFTEQEPLVFESLQAAEAGENFPAPLVDHIILPMNGLEPASVAVQVVGFPTTSTGVHVTATDLTVMAAILLLGRLPASPS